MHPYIFAGLEPEQQILYAKVGPGKQDLSVLYESLKNSAQAILDTGRIEHHTTDDIITILLEVILSELTSSPDLFQYYKVRLKSFSADCLLDQLKIRSRVPQLVQLRQVLFYVLRNRYSFTLVAIGKIFGLDHSTVIHGCLEIDNIIYLNHKDEFTQLVKRVITVFTRNPDQKQIIMSNTAPALALIRQIKNILTPTYKSLLVQTALEHMLCRDLNAKSAEISFLLLQSHKEGFTEKEIRNLCRLIK